MKTIYFPGLDLLYHDAASGFRARDFNAVGALTYNWESPPRFSIWDFGNSVSGFEIRDVRSIAESAKSTFSVRGRENGKTAIVAMNPATYGRARQYVAYSDPEGLPFPQQVFQSLDEALVWLGFAASQIEAAAREIIYESQAD